MSRAYGRGSDDENVYAWAGVRSPHGSPVTKTYNTPGAPSSTSPKRRMHVDSSQVSQFLNPVRGVRDAQSRAGLTPVDHHRSNIAAIKEQSKMNALRKVAEATADPTPAWKRTPSGRTPGSARSAGRPPSASPAPGGRNFIEENLVTAGVPARPPARPKPSTPLDAAGAANDGQRYLQKKDYGKLPEYLMDRKIELARQYEAELAAKEAALIPPGMRVLPEHERLEMLAVLERNRAEVEKAIQKLPFVIETPSQIRWQKELHKRQQEVEEAFKIFSRPKVLVQI